MTPAIDPRERRAGMVGTATVHLAAIAGLVVLGLRTPAPPPVVYAVNLVAAAAPRRTPARAAEAATPTAKQPVAPPDKVVPTPAPPPPPPEPTAAKRDAPTLATKSEVEPLPDVTPSTGTDELTFTQAGIRFQDQEYLDNIVTQIRRRWSNPAGRGLRLRVDVTFTIHRDGSVTDVTVARPSPNFTFNTSARGAIERAAREKAFGPLPTSFNGESLPISFAFTPEDR
jgi:TonB family protein